MQARSRAPTADEARLRAVVVLAVVLVVLDLAVVGLVSDDSVRRGTALEGAPRTRTDILYM